jgi:hypothetical protein
MRRFSVSRVAAFAAIVGLLLSVPSQAPDAADHISLQDASSLIPKQAHRSRDWKVMLLFSIPLITQTVRRR